MKPDDIARANTKNGNKCCDAICCDTESEITAFRRADIFIRQRGCSEKPDISDSGVLLKVFVVVDDRQQKGSQSP